jgi:hypothetical protein
MELWDGCCCMGLWDVWDVWDVWLWDYGTRGLLCMGQWDYGTMAWWDYTLFKTKEIVGFQDDNDLD